MTVFKFSPSKVASLGTEAFAILTNRGATVQPTALELTKILIILDQLVLILRVRKERTSSLPSSSCVTHLHKRQTSPNKFYHILFPALCGLGKLEHD